MSQRDPSKIYISVHREGDTFVLRDQDGRQVAGVRGISFDATLDDVVMLNVRLCDAPITHKGSSAHTGRG